MIDAEQYESDRQRIATFLAAGDEAERARLLALDPIEFATFAVSVILLPVGAEQLQLFDITEDIDE
jgi:hypothetical protein